VLVVIGLLVLWPSPDPGPDVPALSSFEGIYPATTTERNERTCVGADASTRCLSATLRLLEGPDWGTTITIELPANSSRVAGVEVERRVLLGSLGLIASMPITTWLAVHVVGRRGAYAQAPPSTAEREAEEAGPEEHAIPEHRRDAWIQELRSWRSNRRS
jgi:hypothetical protein